jgi:hypothetical protein
MNVQEWSIVKTARLSCVIREESKKRRCVQNAGTEMQQNAGTESNSCMHNEGAKHAGCMRSDMGVTDGNVRQSVLQ